MHEWALAESVVLSIIGHTREKGAKPVDHVTVRLGELQGIDEEVFRFALKEMKREKGIAVRTRIEKEKSSFRCRSCSRIWEHRPLALENNEKEFIHFVPEVSHSYVKCPECGSPDFMILKGRGLSLKFVDGE
jgi:hydrogenase nickel incorporation protein HypA/HybF